MSMKNTKVLDSKAFQNLPELSFLLCKWTIWQPCLPPLKRPTLFCTHRLSECTDHRCARVGPGDQIGLILTFSIFLPWTILFKSGLYFAPKRL
jgi:hypothetical protein